MKRLTLDQTWDECLAMWEWISRKCKGKSREWCSRNEYKLKREWLESHGFASETGKESKSPAPTNDCFFCEYDNKRPDVFIDDSCCCPAKKIDKSFDCMDKEYNYSYHPRQFYAKLKELNAIRLAKK
jgi:hypothetical protein